MLEQGYMLIAGAPFALQVIIGALLCIGIYIVYKFRVPVLIVTGAMLLVFKDTIINKIFKRK